MANQQVLVQGGTAAIVAAKAVVTTPPPPQLPKTPALSSKIPSSLPPPVTSQFVATAAPSAAATAAPSLPLNVLPLSPAAATPAPAGAAALPAVGTQPLATAAPTAAIFALPQLPSQQIRAAPMAAAAAAPNAALPELPPRLPAHKPTAAPTAAVAARPPSQTPGTAAPKAAVKTAGTAAPTTAIAAAVAGSAPLQLPAKVVSSTAKPALPAAPLPAQRARAAGKTTPPPRPLSPKPAATAPAAAGTAIAAPGTINFCSTYEAVCRDLLYKIGCPGSEVTASECGGNPGMDLTSPNLHCICGTFDATTRVAQLVNDHIVQPAGTLVPLLHLAGGNTEVCGSYLNVCNKLLNGIGCPMASRQVLSCDAPGDLTIFSGVCRCGQLDMSRHEAELLVDATVKADVPAKTLPLLPPTQHSITLPAAAANSLVGAQGG